MYVASERKVGLSSKKVDYILMGAKSSSDEHASDVLRESHTASGFYDSRLISELFVTQITTAIPNSIPPLHSGFDFRGIIESR